MSRFLPQKPKAPEPPPSLMREVGGSYMCQTCSEIVHQALFSVETGELGWKCSKGHMSIIKGLDI